MANGTISVMEPCTPQRRDYAAKRRWRERASGRCHDPFA